MILNHAKYNIYSIKVQTNSMKMKSKEVESLLKKLFWPKYDTLHLKPNLTLHLLPLGPLGSRQRSNFENLQYMILSAFEISIQIGPKKVPGCWKGYFGTNFVLFWSPPLRLRNKKILKIVHNKNLYRTSVFPHQM